MSDVGLSNKIPLGTLYGDRRTEEYAMAVSSGEALPPHIRLADLALRYSGNHTEMVATAVIEPPFGQQRLFATIGAKVFYNKLS